MRRNAHAVGTTIAVLKPGDTQHLSQYKFQTTDIEKIADLEAEVAALRCELTVLKQEKADLEILVEVTAEHSDSVEAELHHTAIAALKQSEEMFRTIAEATPIPVFIARLENGGILYANTAASTAFGISPDGFLKSSILELALDGGDRQEFLAAIQSKGWDQNFELQCKRADGSRCWVTVSLQRLIFNGELTVLAALCDITQQKAEEESLKRQVKELQIEIDHTRLAQQVAEITQSDYFQQLQEEIQLLRCPPG